MAPQRVAYAPLAARKTGATQLATVVVMGATHVAGPLGVAKELTELKSMKACNDRCVYYKMFDDGTPLRKSRSWVPNCGVNLLAITNGRNHTVAKEWGCPIGDAELRQVLPRAICPEHSAESMRQLCESPAVEAEIINVMGRLPSGRLFCGACVLWGLLRVLHDLLLLFGVREDFTLAVSMLSALALAAMASASLAWSMGMLGVFYAPVGEGCGCFYRREGISAIFLLVAPGAFLWATQSKVAEVLRAVIGGDYLIVVKYHVALRHVSSTLASPTASLLGVETFGGSGGELGHRATPALWVRYAAMFLLPLVCVGVLPSVMITGGALSVRLVELLQHACGVHTGLSLQLMAWVLVLGVCLGEPFTALLFLLPSKMPQLIWTVERMRPELRHRSLALFSSLRWLFPYRREGQPELEWALPLPEADFASL